MVKHKKESEGEETKEKRKDEEWQEESSTFPLSQPFFSYISQWGNVTAGVVTQCMKDSKAFKPRGMDQYAANVLLKLNIK